MMYKVGIVGASKSKWSKEQIPFVEMKITQIFGKHIAITPKEDLLLVSGGCPKGKKRFWCHELERWVDNPNDYAGDGYRFTEAYDEGGVDTWSEIIADGLSVEKKISRPEVNQWNDEVNNVEKYGACPLNHDLVSRNHNCNRLKGYRSRNIQIAKVADILYVISPKCSCSCHDKEIDGVHTNNCCRGGRLWNGGEWTGNFAVKLGKPVVRIAI